MPGIYNMPRCLYYRIQAVAVAREKAGVHKTRAIMKALHQMRGGSAPEKAVPSQIAPLGRQTALLY
jgi:hypothetical protein